MKLRIELFLICCLVLCGALALNSLGCGSNSSIVQSEDSEDTPDDTQNNPDETVVPPEDNPSPTPTSAEYWVAKSGSDDNPGTQELPFLTLAKAAREAEINPKDIYIYPETYYEEENINIQDGVSIYGAGNETLSPIHYRPVINFRNCPTSPCGISIQKSTNETETTIDSLAIIGKSETLRIVDASVHITNNYISTINDGDHGIGVSIIASEINGIISPVIEDNLISTGALWTSEGYTYGILIENTAQNSFVSSEITNNSISSGNGFWGSIGIGVESSGERAETQLTITGNTVTSGASDWYSHAIYLSNVNDTIIDGNMITAGNITNDTIGSATGGITVTSLVPATVTIQNNFIYGGEDAESSYGISTGGDINADIYFNTIYAGKGSNAITIGLYFPGSGSASAVNNILCSGESNRNYGIVEVNENVVSTLKNNLFCKTLDTLFVRKNYGSYLDVDRINAIGRPFADNIVGNPDFVNETDHDYHLSDGSDAIDKAIPIEGISTDIDTDPRPQGERPDIGADEYR